MQPAIQAGCQATCNLCPELTTTTTTAAPTMPPDVQAGPSMAFAFDVKGHTDWSAVDILGRLRLMKRDPVPYTQRFFVELESTAMPASDVPSRLWVIVSLGPSQVIIPPDEIAEDEKALTTSSIIAVS